MKNYLILPLMLLLWGCGSGSDAGKVFVPQSGHPVKWADPLVIGTDSFHGTVAKKEPQGPVGSALYLRHCAACHGEDAKGKIGADIRGVPITFITAAIKAVPLMKGHSILSEQELQDITEYLAALALNVQPVTAVIDTEVCRECHGTELDGDISRVSCFSCHKGPKGDIGHPSGWTTAINDPVLFHGRYGRDFVVACTACHGVDLLGGIGPRCVSCHDGKTAPILSSFP